MVHIAIMHMNYNVNLSELEWTWLTCFGKKSSWMWVIVAHILEDMNVSERGSRKMWTFLSLYISIRFLYLNIFFFLKNVTSFCELSGEGKTHTAWSMADDKSRTTNGGWSLSVFWGRTKKKIVTDDLVSWLASLIE